MEYVVYAFSALGIVVMAVDVVLAFRLKAALDRGDLGRGEVGRKWGLLTWMLLFFFLGYLASPLLLVSQLDPRYVNLLVFLVFLLGAAFVYVVIGIIRDILSFLDLLK